MEHELLWSLSSRGTRLRLLPGFPCRSEPHTLLGCLRPGLGRRANSRALGGSGFKDTGARCSQLGYIGTEAVRALSVTSGTHTFPHPSKYTPGPVLPVGERGVGCMCPVGGMRNGMRLNIAVRQVMGFPSAGISESSEEKQEVGKEYSQLKYSLEAQTGKEHASDSRPSLSGNQFSVCLPLYNLGQGDCRSVLTMKSQPWPNFSFS